MIEHTDIPYSEQPKGATHYSLYADGIWLNSMQQAYYELSSKSWIKMASTSWKRAIDKSMLITPQDNIDPEIIEFCIDDIPSVMVGCKQENSGGSCNYYIVKIDRPTTLPKPYTVECNDLIESLGLTCQEANIYKEIFRTANERTNNNGKAGNNPKRAAEKVLFFAVRHAIINGVDVESILKEINLS